MIDRRYYRDGGRLPARNRYPYSAAMNIADRRRAFFKSRFCLPALLIFSGIMSGCTSIHIAGAEPKVIYGLGIVNVHVQPEADKPLLVQTDGLGIVAGARSVTLGALRETIATFPQTPACHTLILVESKTQFDALKKILEEDPTRLGSLCIINKGNS